ncbi:hypothetical protein ALI144C_52740 [Actinosynnema sp. ALI-1.44]|uniref:hypothetical protein n=1 Tax=Actinosynnema sp. ALI-1.44 TaxID=1933779 RepID=UPI00097BB767|nr:hypothetical protein [Actinosynnema sp. ALI-1.44]ONI71191.1 hypothetical protein ALI144C_52740 [Actinosynnema sp. ALI-1.44]
MNLNERLRAAAASIAAPACALDVRRKLRQVETRYETVTSTTADTEKLDSDIELHAALERAYQAGVDARSRGDLTEAAHQLLIAADQQIGDASVQLAEVLVDLGDYTNALRWCAVAAADGFGEAAELAHRCRDRRDMIDQQRHHGQARVTARVNPRPLLSRPPFLTREDQAERDQFLAHATAITLGATALESFWTASELPWSIGAHPQWEGRPVTLWDVRQTEAATRALRTLDYQYGGANVRSAVLTQLGWAEPMLAGQGAEDIRKRLRTALADLHTLAGWVSFDANLIASARLHFTRALDLLSHTGNNGILAHVLWRAGRMYLHSDAPHEALKYFQLGEIAAEKTGDATLTALAVGSQAWVAGLMSNEDEAIHLLRRMRDELSAPLLEPSAPTYVTADALLATAGSAHAALARHTDARHAPSAIRLLTAALDVCEPSQARSRTFIFTAMSGSHLASDDITAARHTGYQALDTADNVVSRGLDGEFSTLKRDAEQHAHPTARMLANRIAERLLDRAS